MSDAELARQLQLAPQMLADARRGLMSPRFAVRLGRFLEERQAIEHAGDVLLAVTIERLQGEERATLHSFAQHVKRLRIAARRVGESLAA